MIPLDPLPNLIDQVYERILAGITDRTLPPGHRIRQNELAEKLGVSRQPVSHALHLLHRQGLVAESGRKGFEVTRLDPRRIRQLYEVRGAIDALAARLAAERVRADTSGRAHLEAALRAGRAIDKRRRWHELIALDVDFHRAIYHLADNPAIEEMIAPQWPHMRRSMATVLAELDYRTSAWAEHETIAAHIRRQCQSRRKRGAGACDRRGANDGRQAEAIRRSGVMNAVIPGHASSRGPE